MLKILGIPAIISISVCIIYHIITSKFNIPFCYTIGLGLVIFMFVFFVLNDLDIV